MTFEELAAKVSGLILTEVRAKEPDYFEAVINKINWEVLGESLQNYFGDPLKPAGAAPGTEANQVSAAYGGISQNQTLYFKKNAQAVELAMLWPWSNGTSLTVKMVRETS